MQTHKTIFNTLLTTLMLVSSLAFAAEGENRVMPEQRPAEGKSEIKPSIGVSLGFANTQEGRRNGTNWGLDWAAQPYIPYSLGVELSGYVSDGSDSTATLTRTKVLAKGAYNFGGTQPLIRDSYVGLGLGPVFDNELNKYDVGLGVAPQIGFDIPIGPKPASFTLGANANYLFIVGPGEDAFAFNGVAKYWF